MLCNTHSPWTLLHILLLVLPIFAQPTAKQELQRRQFEGYVITSLEFWSYNNTDSIQFSVYDQTPADNATRICYYHVANSNETTSASDGSSGDPASGGGNYVPCSSATKSEDYGFEWVAHSGSAAGFSIRAKHSYMDESLGPCSQNPDGTPIYCGVTSWAQGTITAEEITCTDIDVGHADGASQSSCGKMTRCSVDDDVHLQVYQAIA